LLRVAMVVPHFPPPVVGGLERQAYELALAVRRRGIDVWVLSGRFAPQQPRTQLVDGIPVVRVRFPRAKWLRFPVTGLALLHALVTRRREFDVLHLHNLSWFGGLSVLIARALGKPVLAKLPTATRWAFRERSLRLRLFLSCDAIALMTSESIDDFRRLGYPEGRIFGVTNGVATSRFHPGPPPDPGSERPLQVIFSGRLDAEKGLLDLLAVWPAVLRRIGAPARLALCGEGPQEAELREAIASLRLSESVELRGRIADMAGALQQADVFVLPSFIEGNSNAVLEAMATGLPIVSTLAGGTPLLVGPAGHPWLVTPRDRAALEDRLVRLLTEPQTRREVGGAMLERAQTVLGIEAVAARYASVYERLASGRRDEVRACSSPLFAAAPPPRATPSVAIPSAGE